VYTLRYYDKEGLMPFEDRTPSGTRVFKDSDIETLKIVESTGMPITENKTFLNGVLRGIPP
jgi:DNA-binding transcriptional MerR regulator